jgi:hypothetical protein
VAVNANTIECPRGCKTRNGRYPIASSIRGWKHHMTKQHGGWTPEEIAAVTGTASIDPAQGKSLFMSEIDGGIQTPDAGKEKIDEDGNLAPEQTKEPPVKRVQFKSKKLRKFLSSLPELVLKAKGVTADEDDRELMDGASEMMEEMFGIAFEVPDTQWVIKSRLFALLFPIAAVFLVWAKHEFSFNLNKEKENKETPAP